MPAPKHNQLDVRTISSLIKANRDGLHLDGEGLYLHIKNGGASWLLRYSVPDGRRREMGLGPVRQVTLAQARDAADNARRLLRTGVDPVEARKGIRSAAQAERGAAPQAKTFRECWREWQPQNLSTQTNHASRYVSAHISEMERYVLPIIGAMPVDKITEAEVLEVMQPIWLKIHTTAMRIRNSIERVLSYAKKRKYRTGDNPAALDNLDLTKVRNREICHHARVEPEDMPAFMTRLRSVEGVAARAAEMTILSTLRSNAAMPTRWDEIDEARKRWVVPQVRMKMWPRPFHVPLTDRMLVILDELRRLRRNEFIFPGVFNDSISRDTLRFTTYPLAEHKITMHGFRSSFRDWAGSDSREFEDVIIELCLAHTATRRGTVAAYMRDDYIERRAVVMQAWTDFCAGKC